MLLVHADGMSLRMVVTWPGLLLLANQFVPIAVFVLNRFCRAQIFVPVIVATCVKMP
jgi:hypothetical protein